MIHLNVYTRHTVHTRQNRYKRTLRPPCKFIYTHINRGKYSVKHHSSHGWNYMKTVSPLHHVNSITASVFLHLKLTSSTS